MKSAFWKRMAAWAVLLAMFAFPAFAEETQKLDTYYTLAVHYINAGEYDKALTYLNACFDYCDEKQSAALAADLYLKRGCVYTMKGDNEPALNDLAKATEISPEMADAYLVRVQIYSDSGLYSEAVENMEKYIELTGDQEMYATLAQLYEAKGDYEKALSSYGAYTDAAAVSDAEANYQRGVYKMNLGLFSEAAQEFEACADDETYGVSSLYNIGVCRMNAQDYAGALEALDRCVEAGGEFDGLYYNRAVCEMSQTEYEKAIADFTVSIEKESYGEDALYNRAVCRMSSGLFADAAADFTAYLGREEGAQAPRK